MLSFGAKKTLDHSHSPHLAERWKALLASQGGFGGKGQKGKGIVLGRDNANGKGSNAKGWGKVHVEQRQEASEEPAQEPEQPLLALTMESHMDAGCA